MPFSLRRPVAFFALGVLGLPFLGVLLGVSVVGTSLGSADAAAGPGGGGGPAVPIEWLDAEQTASTSCASSPWTVLGALGFLSSGSGRTRGTSLGWHGARPSRFGIEEPTADLATDATNAATALCGAVTAAGSLSGALRALTGSSQVAGQIEALATALSAEPLLGAAQAQALAFAAGALGLPYRWGGNGPDAYDCSGLMVAAWRSAGVGLPRTAQEQFDATAHETGRPSPGDLVFFGLGPTGIEHVGIELGDGLMIDAPYTGAFVRIEPDGFADAVDVRRVL